MMRSSGRVRLLQICFTSAAGSGLNTLNNVPTSLFVAAQRQCSENAPTTANAIASKWKNASTISITSFNLEKELVRSTIPTLLVFYSDMHAASKAFVSKIKATAIERNTQASTTRIRVATVSCDQEMALARQFQADRLGIPLTYMLYKGQMLDRLSGDLAGPTLEKAIDAFLKAVSERFGHEADAKPQAVEETLTDEQNPAFHVREAKKMLEAPGVDLALVDATLDNAQRLCAEPIETLKKSIGFGQKRVTPEMTNKMRENTHIRCMAQALGTRVTVALRRGDMKAAVQHARCIRADFSWALKDERGLAHDVVQVEISEIAQYDAQKHDQSYFDTKGTPEEQYDAQLRLACRHYAIGEHEECINVLLGLVRTDVQASRSTQSRARQTVLKVFEALGADSDIVQKARKTLSRYLFC